jgi:hypothetical protein
LLRSPEIKESRLKDFDYQLALADESLRLGAHLRSVFKAGSQPKLEALWAVCRNWRFGRVDTHSYSMEIELFATSRMSSGYAADVTPIDIDDSSYSYLIDRIANLFKHASSEQATEAQASAFKCDLFSMGSDPAQLITFQHSYQFDNQTIPLTKLKIALTEEGKPMAHPWVYYGYGQHPIALNEDISLFFGAMVHVDPQDLGLMAQALESKFQAFGELFQQEFSKNNVKNTLTHDLKQARFSHVMPLLGEIHYLLAHAMLDHRGSAAKSELMVRSLAASVGLELPPFKKGFVPDLEAFLSSSDDFAKNYSSAFEHVDFATLVMGKMERGFQRLRKE